MVSQHNSSQSSFYHLKRRYLLNHTNTSSLENGPIVYDSFSTDIKNSISIGCRYFAGLITVLSVHLRSTLSIQSTVLNWTPFFRIQIIWNYKSAIGIPTPRKMWYKNLLNCLNLKEKSTFHEKSAYWVITKSAGNQSIFECSNPKYILMHTLSLSNCRL